MAEYNENIGAYVIEYDDVIICWDDDPGEDCKKQADAVRKAYNNNIRNIAQVIYDETGEFFGVTDVEDVIEKLARPQIYPDNGQVVYCEHTLDNEHIITFEYIGDDFSDIGYVAVDG